MVENSWHVLQVVANHERRVAQNLRVRALEHYLPLYSERSRWSDRTVVLERPLFAGYVFVRFQPQTRLTVIGTPGVLRLLGDDQRSTVTAGEIDRIREGLLSGCLLRPHRGLAIGTPVRVSKGVFAGVEGKVTEFRRQCNVILSLTAVQQSFSLEIDLADIEVLSKAVPDSPLQAVLANAG